LRGVVFGECAVSYIRYSYLNTRSINRYASALNTLQTDDITVSRDNNIKDLAGIDQRFKH